MIIQRMYLIQVVFVHLLCWCILLVGRAGANQYPPGSYCRQVDLGVCAATSCLANDPKAPNCADCQNPSCCCCCKAKATPGLPEETPLEEPGSCPNPLPAVCAVTLCLANNPDAPLCSTCDTESCCCCCKQPSPPRPKDPLLKTRGVCPDPLPDVCAATSCPRNNPNAPRCRECRSEGCCCCCKGPNRRVIDDNLPKDPPLEEPGVCPDPLPDVCAATSCLANDPNAPLCSTCKTESCCCCCKNEEDDDYSNDPLPKKGECPKERPKICMLVRCAFTAEQCAQCEDEACCCCCNFDMPEPPKPPAGSFTCPNQLPKLCNLVDCLPGGGIPCTECNSKECCCCCTKDKPTPNGPAPGSFKCPKNKLPNVCALVLCARPSENTCDTCESEECCCCCGRGLPPAVYLPKPGQCDAEIKSRVCPTVDECFFSQPCDDCQTERCCCCCDQ